MAKVDYKNKQYIENIVKNSINYFDAIKKLGLIPGANTKVLKKYIKIHNIDASHLDIGKYKKRIVDGVKTEELLINDSNTPRITIKRRIIKDKLISYECECCGNKGVWNGVKISLILDHKNGVNNDHRLENLRFLCPNCDSIQPTFKRKNKGI